MEGIHKIEPPAYREDLVLMMDLLRSELAWRSGSQNEPPCGLDFVELTEDEFRTVMGVCEVAIEALNQVAYPGASPSFVFDTRNVEALNNLVKQGKAVTIPGRSDG